MLLLAIALTVVALLLGRLTPPAAGLNAARREAVVLRGGCCRLAGGTAGCRCRAVGCEARGDRPGESGAPRDVWLSGERRRSVGWQAPA